jgi:hypothetical protein
MAHVLSTDPGVIVLLFWLPAHVDKVSAAEPFGCISPPTGLGAGQLPPIESHFAASTLPLMIAIFGQFA